MKVVLSINAGSSSVKISAYTADKATSPQQIAEAQISGLTAPPAKLKYSRYGKSMANDEQVGKKVHVQDAAFSLLLDTLIDDGELREIGSKKDILIACHRIVHGGDYTDSRIITKDTYHHLEQLSDLAPLHNGAALGIVDSCMKQLPDATNIACFDSQFHATIPAHIATYPINPGIAKNSRLRKYGFHGLSYAFIARSVGEFLNKDMGKLNIIALHLGSGASACAIKGGKSWDTSMGLTPLAGLPGATRSGSIDPSLVFHYASDIGKLSPASTKHLHISRAEEIHDLDVTEQTQIDVYVGRGILIESRKPTWLWGTASEHNVLYQYQLSNAKNIFFGMMQTETPYYEPSPRAPTPFATGIFPNDPAFEDCSATDLRCAMAWALRIVDSTGIHVYSAGLYSFFSNYSQACLGSPD